MKETELEEVLIIAELRRKLIRKLLRTIVAKGRRSNTPVSDEEGIVKSEEFPDYVERKRFSEMADRINGKVANTTSQAFIEVLLDEIKQVESTLEKTIVKFKPFHLTDIPEGYLDKRINMTLSLFDEGDQVLPWDKK